MKRLVFATAALLVACALPAQAQLHSSCNNAGDGQDACQKTADLFHYLSPQLGSLIAGGNAMVGQTGTLGGFPHFRAALRVNILQSHLPDISQHTPRVGTAASDHYDVTRQFAPLPQLDAAIGIYRGFSLGITNTGGIDLLLSAAYLPSFNNASVNLDAGSARIGAGVRVGLIQETLFLPGVSLTYLRRGLPKINVTADIEGDSLYVNELDLTADSWRLVAGKRLLVIALAAGVGQDRLSSSANLSAYIAPRLSPLSGPVNVSIFNGKQTVTRNNIFANASFSLLIMNIVAEVGQSSGGNVSTFNTFSKSANEAKLYGSIAFRVGL